VHNLTPATLAITNAVAWPGERKEEEKEEESEEDISPVKLSKRPERSYLELTGAALSKRLKMIRLDTGLSLKGYPSEAEDWEGKEEEKEPNYED